MDENASVLNDSFAEGEEDENDSLHITTEQELSKLEQELGTGAGWEKHDASGICLHQNFEDDLAILNLLLQEREDNGVDAMECDEDGDFCEDQTLASPLAGNSVISTNTNATSTCQNPCTSNEEHHDSKDDSFTFCVSSDPTGMDVQSCDTTLPETCWMRASGGLAKGQGAILEVSEPQNKTPDGWPLGLLTAALSTWSPTSNAATENMVVALVCNLQMHHLGAHHRTFYNHIYAARHVLMKQVQSPESVDETTKADQVSGDGMSMLTDSSRVHENPLFHKSLPGRQGRPARQAVQMDSSVCSIAESIDDSEVDVASPGSACEDDWHKAPSKTAAKQVTSNADTECTQDDILGMWPILSIPVRGYVRKS